MTATATPPRGSGKLGPRTASPRATRRRAGSGITAGRVARVLAMSAWILLRVIVIATCLAIVVAWRGFDVTPLGIVSGSMSPTIPTHSL
ncbi:MAG: hypothetical protein JWM25_1250, partial [Thermoleophilia bacterium]|nr:hypothetical protein [Thermoleophilia bacterium]